MTETKNSLSFRRIGRFVRILLLFAGGCQILFGLAYLVANLGKMQGFGDTYELLDAGKTFVLDDRTGLIYPLILAGADLIHEWTGMPFVLPLQVLQLVVAYYSSNLLLRTFCKETAGNRLFLETASLFLITSAPLMQLHLSGLPYSLALSVLCFQYVFCRKTLAKEYKKCNVLFYLGFFILEELIFPWMGLAGIMFAGICVCSCRGDKKRFARMLLVAAVLFICFRATVGLTLLKASNRGKMQNSVAAVIGCHFTWSKLADNYFFWDEEVKEVFSEEDAIAVTNTESLVLTEFGAEVDEAYGYFGAQKVYLRMVANVFQNRTKEVINDGITELRDYGMMPLTVVRNLNGYGRSQTGFNVGRLREHSPGMGSLLLIVSMYLIPISLALTGLIFITSAGKMVDIKFRIYFVVFVITWLLTAFWGYFSFDYKRGYLLWYLMELPGAFSMVFATEGEKKLLW